MFGEKEIVRLIWFKCVKLLMSRRHSLRYNPICRKFPVSLMDFVELEHIYCANINKICKFPWLIFDYIRTKSMRLFTVYLISQLNRNLCWMPHQKQQQQQQQIHIQSNQTHIIYASLSWCFYLFHRKQSISIYLTKTPWTLDEMQIFRQKNMQILIPAYKWINGNDTTRVTIFWKNGSHATGLIAIYIHEKNFTYTPPQSINGNNVWRNTWNLLKSRTNLSLSKQY